MGYGLRATGYGQTGKNEDPLPRSPGEGQGGGISGGGILEHMSTSRVPLPKCSSSLRHRFRKLLSGDTEGREPLEHLTSGAGFDRIFRHPSGVDGT
jgi:hypothetical protein